MKKLAVIALMLVTIQVSAQGPRQGKVRHADFTPEEMAQLQTKKMTLDLDLTASQQREVSAINLENAKARKAKMESFKNRKENTERPSKEDILKMKNEKLDAQIATKKKMKAILNADQYEKFEKLEGRKQKMRGKRKMKKREKNREDGERRERKSQKHRD